TCTYRKYLNPNTHEPILAMCGAARLVAVAVVRTGSDVISMIYRHIKANPERGMTLIETLIVLAVSSLLAGMTVSFSINWLAKERLRAGSYQVFSQLNQARLQAVKRNRSCRFTVDTATRVLNVIDLQDPADPADDVEISREVLHPYLGFQMPDGTAPVTLNPLSGTRFEATFSSSGVVTSGAGNIALGADGQFRQVSLFVAGGMRLRRWDGTEWAVGS
ncbi:MAG: GspH/FimT family pseudopilin, partial [Acidobacteriota bacterium]